MLPTSPNLVIPALATIKSGDSIVARIEFYGEVESEDERLRVLLANLCASLEA